ncbi:copper resistance protein NlpE N-terminal domain-containing protein [Prevotella dentasini]|uniref:copper resistance protein NlpE N-terminal domain-containing protein n=1 Tax=Prevotella dentasini TaxID=589537 RepID=UPI00046A98AF|nr:copper resistance protein NlpE N-terminal domain-containing protein [Prevotella dentasini]
MKKIILMVAACAAMVACNNGKTTANNESSDTTAADTVAADSAIYEGMTPAADVYGIKYRVALAQDSTNGFSLSEAYMKSETEIDTASNYNGKYEIVKKDVNGKSNTYYQFALGADDKATFLVLNDSTLRMVNSDFEEAVAKEGMNYDLKLQK